MTTIAAYFREWAALFKLGHVRPVTYQKYLETASKLDHYFPEVALPDVTRQHYQMFINRLAERYEKITVTDAHHQVQACLRDAVYDGLVSKDPTYGVKIFGKPHITKHAMVLSRAEAATLLTSINPTHDLVDAGIHVCVKTGVRFGELLGITPADVTRHTIHINKTLNYKTGRELNSFQPTKNPSSVRTLPIDTTVAGLLHLWAEGTPAGESIFARATLYNDTWNARLTAVCTSASLPGITMHGLRHTHASLLLTAGVPITVIARRLGHANTITTQRVYLHLIKELEDDGNQHIIETMSSLDRKEDD